MQQLLLWYFNIQHLSPGNSEFSAYSCHSYVLKDGAVDGCKAVSPSYASWAFPWADVLRTGFPATVHQPLVCSVHLLVTNSVSISCRRFLSDHRRRGSIKWQVDTCLAVSGHLLSMQEIFLWYICLLWFPVGKSLAGRLWFHWYQKGVCPQPFQRYLTCFCCLIYYSIWFMRPGSAHKQQLIPSPDADKDTSCCVVLGPEYPWNRNSYAAALDR